MKAAEQDPLAKSSRRRVRRLRRVPQESSYKAAPKGLPIYFYHPTWFNDLVPAQQHSIPDRTRIAFLPNSSESLLPKAKRHPDENSADSTFTKKYWEVVVEPYGLLNVESSEEEEFAAETQGAGQDKEGEGIDLTQPSKGSDSDTSIMLRVTLVTFMTRRGKMTHLWTKATGMKTMTRMTAMMRMTTSIMIKLKAAVVLTAITQ
ncbi:hypothetical protein PTTG_11161 [Puccinia triticina 1-1 BBBD Race 1]|uniref:Uncharacterized protein n=1 Tax=Puccinia triticina (isolate 1-1 / race 1 (BBBD)) TaxID=630390 RepID=A0A180GJR2_PUCT1|nr:hypothetical protein PTTG_11161 [Puccinia triticina 1-1 BBBD Race 1]